MIALVFSRLVIVVFSQEMQEVVRADASSSISVNSLKRRMRCKNSNVAQALSAGFKSALSIADCNQEVFQSVFGFVAKHPTNN